MLYLAMVNPILATILYSTMMASILVTILLTTILLNVQPPLILTVLHVATIKNSIVDSDTSPGEYVTYPLTSPPIKANKLSTDGKLLLLVTVPAGEARQRSDSPLCTLLVRIEYNLSSQMLAHNSRLARWKIAVLKVGLAQG